MRTAQFTLHDILAVYKRRRKLLYIPLILVTVVAITGAFLLPRSYESYITLMAQREEIMNPLVSFELQMRMGDEDRLQTVNEILYSRITVARLIDSLGLDKNIRSEADEQDLIKSMQGRITTERRGSDSFRITFTDGDPRLAQHAATLLASLLMETIRAVETQRNDQAVQFYEKKLEEIREKFEGSQRKIVSALQSRVSSLPMQTQAQYSQLENLEDKISVLDTKIKTYQQYITTLQMFPKEIRTDNGKQALYDLQRADVPYAADLRILFARYDENIRRYTMKYPEVEKLENQIVDLLDRMKTTMQTELASLQPQRSEYERRRADLVSELKQSSVSQRLGGDDVDSDYGIYKRLYDEMTVKLEQAQASRDLGVKGANHLLIIDPAVVPSKPSKPNRPQIVLAGVGLGFFLGILSIIFRELLDTTLRSQRDIEVYQKPVIAFISDGSNDGGR